MSIQYFSEDIDFKLPTEAQHTRWILSIIERHHKRAGEISYIFCSDEYLLQINREHLNHDYYTDIITFDNADEADVIEADIFISIDRVKENAANEQTPFETELNRVMIHGVLHLLGYGDKTDADKKQMREKEDACLSLWKDSCST